MKLFVAMLLTFSVVHAATICKTGSTEISLTSGLPIYQAGVTDWGFNSTCNSDSTVCRNRFVYTKADILLKFVFAECVNAIACTPGYKNESSFDNTRWTWTQTKCCDTDLCNVAPSYNFIDWTSPAATSAPTTTGPTTNGPTSPTSGTTSPPTKNGAATMTSTSLQFGVYLYGIISVIIITMMV